MPVYAFEHKVTGERVEHIRPMGEAEALGREMAGYGYRRLYELGKQISVPGYWEAHAEGQEILDRMDRGEPVPNGY